VLTFSLQTYDLLRGGPFTLFIATVLLIWVTWAAKMVRAGRYSPFTDPVPDVRVSVVIPVVDEPVELFREVLSRIADQSPDETVVVINGPRNLRLEQVCTKVQVPFVWTEVPGKRNAVQVGVGATTGEVVVLVDSDTLWEPEALSELLRPFARPYIGGVTPYQSIRSPERNLLTRWASWSEKIRWHSSMPAYSVSGSVGCLPGRTIAFRREVLVRAMPEFLSERFLGVHLEVSDDRSLTNLCLKQGYLTVFQSTSRVVTDAPTKLRVFIRQQLRWARGSQYNTLRMLPWMLGNARFLAFGFIVDILLPFALLGVWGAWLVRTVFFDTGTNMVGYVLALGMGVVVNSVLFALVGMVLSLLLRQWWMLRGEGLHVLGIVLINTFLLVPIRAWGFARMNADAAWGTRSGAFAGTRTPWYWQLVPLLLAFGLLAGFVWVGMVSA
jgi:hyaluronan synthase